MSEITSSSATPRISFVIPQKGRLDLLRGTLRSIARQRMGAGDALASPEVILMTQDDSLDDVRALMEDALGLTEGFRYRCIDACGFGTIAAVRNAGARLATADLLAFLDADIELADDWAEVLLEELASDPRRVLVSAVQVPPTAPSTVERIQTELSRMKADVNVSFLSGHNLLVRRDAFERAGGFPEELETCEDYVFTDRVNAVGTLFLSARTSYVHLGEDKSHAVVFRKEIWRGRSNLASITGRRIGPAEWPSFVVPVVVTLALGAVPIALLAGAVALAFVLTGLAIAPILAYTVRLYIAAKGRLDLIDVLGYYLTYFPARGIGMLGGLRELPLFRSRSTARL